LKKSKLKTDFEKKSILKSIIAHNYYNENITFTSRFVFKRAQTKQTEL